MDAINSLIGLGNDILNLTAKATKAKINIWENIILKSYAHQRNHQQNKKET